MDKFRGTMMALGRYDADIRRFVHVLATILAQKRKVLIIISTACHASMITRPISSRK